MTAKDAYKVAESVIRRGWHDYRDSNNEMELDNAYAEARRDIMTARLSEETEERLLDWFMI